MSTNLTSSQRREFVRAFVDQAWAWPGGDRPTARVHVALLVTMGGLLIAIVVGVIMQLLRPIPLAGPPAPATVPSAVPTWAAVAGWDCGTGPDRGFEISGRTDAWYTVGAGGWPGDGCHGTFQAIPLSGKADRPDQDTSIVWWFAPGAGITSCELAVYLPAPARRQDAAATAVRMTVHSGRGGGALAALVVNQTAAPGTWWVLGSYPVGEAGIAVRTDNQGVPAAAADRLAVTQVLATCTGVA